VLDVWRDTRDGVPSVDRHLSAMDGRLGWRRGGVAIDSGRTPYDRIAGAVVRRDL
jgi:hypothetical protein